MLEHFIYEEELKIFAKKIISIILAVTLSMCFCISAFGSERDKISKFNDDFFIRTSSIPQEANNYAIDIFSRLSESNFFAMGFNASEISNLSLSPGFCMRDSLDTDYIGNIYHYLIKSNDDFIGSLVVIESNGEYNFQISKSDYAKELNNVRKVINKDNIFTVVATEESYYCANNTNLYILDINEKSSNVLNSISTKIESQSSFIINELSMPVVDEITVNVADSICEEPNLSYNSGYDQYIINVPYCSNVRMNGVGTCWISVAASIIDYKLNGSFSSEASANQYRNLILQNSYVISNNYAGSISDVCAFINSPTWSSYTVYGGMPSFTILQALSYMGSPCAIEYLSMSPWSTAENHTVVLAGFSCLSSSPHDPTYQSCYIMDPNNSGGLMMISFSSYYYPWWNGNQALVWNSTAINSADMPF